MPSLDELATAAGVTSLSLGPWPEEEDVRYGCWGVLDSVRVRVHRLALHDCLVIDFLQSELLDLLPPPIDDTGNDPIPLEEDGALPVALAFRDACERLRPEAAVVISHSRLLQEPQYPQWLDACYTAVLGMDPNLLDVRCRGLMYVGPDMAAEWEPQRFANDRDSLPVKEGKIFFPGTGWGRWF